MQIRKHLVRYRWQIAVTLLLAAAAAWYYFTHEEDFTRENLVAYGRGLPALWFVAVFLLLPVVGGPLTIFLVLAGVRFGFPGGMGVSAGVVFFHHFVAYRLTHGYFREPVKKWLHRRHRKIPSIPAKHRIWFTVLFASVHGPPYAMKLYLLALTDLPFRIYFWVGAPVYIAFCVIPVGAGSAVTTFDMTWIYVVLVGLAAVWLLGYVIRRRYKAKGVLPEPD